MSSAGKIDSQAGRAEMEEAFLALIKASSEVAYRMSPDWKEMRFLQGKDFLSSTSEPESAWLEKFVHPDDQPQVLAAINHAIQTKSIFESEHRVVRADGTPGWTFSRAIPLTDAKGEIREWFGKASDITVRKQAEAALRETGERFRAMFDRHKAAKLVIEPDSGAIVDANAAAVEFYGYSREELCAMRIDQINQLPPAEVAAELQRALAEQRNYFEFPHRLASGEVRWVQVYSTPVPIQGRTLLYSIVHDITERKAAEERLRRNQETFQWLIQENPFGVYVVDADFRLALVSRGSQRVFSQVRPLIGRDFAEVLRCIWPEPFAAEAIGRFQHTLRTGEPFVALSTVERRRDIEAVEAYDWRIERITMPDGRFAVVCYFYDLSERQQLEEQVRQSEAKYRNLFEITKKAELALRESEQRLRLAKSAAQLGIHDFNLVTGELNWDDRVRELWGIGPDDPLSYDLFMSRLHPDDRVPTQAAVDRAVDPSGNGRYHAEYRLVHPGRTIWVEATGQVTFEQGHAIRLVGTIQDITERKEFQAELERLVTERTAKLQELVSELEHFSYSITHDMRAPLRAMQCFAEAFAEAWAEGQQQDAERFFQRVRTAALRMDSLIRDALSYGEAVRKHLPLSPVDPGLLLRGMLDTYPEFQGPQARIQVQPDLPLVFGNEAGLTQVFSNLLNNAIKFAKPGEPAEVRVRAELTPRASETVIDPVTDPQPVHSTGFAPMPSLPGASNGHATNWVRIWVEDRGIGISDAMLPRVFNMFARGNNDSAGTGIGLALVRKVVDRMGGRVGVESQEGQGSRFWVELAPAG